MGNYERDCPSISPYYTLVGWMNCLSDMYWVIKSIGIHSETSLKFLYFEILRNLSASFEMEKYVRGIEPSNFFQNNDFRLVGW